MTPERAALVRLARETRNLQAYWIDLFPLNLWQQFKWGWRVRKTRRALAAYDAAHPEEDK